MTIVEKSMVGVFVSQFINNNIITLKTILFEILILSEPKILHWQ